jgi:hypothetical protein
MNVSKSSSSSSSSSAAHPPANMRALAAWGFGVLAVLVVALWFLVGFNVFGSNLAVKGTLEVGGAIDAKAGAQVQGTLAVGGDLAVHGVFKAAAGAQIQGDLAVGGDINGGPLRIGGVQSNANVQFFSETIESFVDTTFYYQLYGSILHVSGLIRGKLVSVEFSRIVSCIVSMPYGYTLSSPSGRYMAVSGGGIFERSDSSMYIATACISHSPSQYSIMFATTDAQPVTTISGNLVLSFSVYLDQIITA